VGQQEELSKFDPLSQATWGRERDCEKEFDYGWLAYYSWHGSKSDKADAVLVDIRTAHRNFERRPLVVQKQTIASGARWFHLAILNQTLDYSSASVAEN